MWRVLMKSWLKPDWIMKEHVCVCVLQVMQFIEKKQQNHRQFIWFKLPVWFSAQLDPRGPLQPLCFTLSLSLWPLTSAGMCWLTLRVRLKSSPGLRLEPSSQRLWFVCTLLFSSSFSWHMTLSLYSSCVFQASSFPCVVIYVMDTSRSVNPVTFMSNMLYACRYITVRLLL